MSSSSRMLKKAPNCVLASPTSSTYPKGTPAVLSTAAALLDAHFEHPALGLVHTGFVTYGRLPDAERRFSDDGVLCTIFTGSAATVIREWRRRVLIGAMRRAAAWRLAVRSRKLRRVTSCPFSLPSFRPSSFRYRSPRRRPHRCGLP
jgi:hypothetical protein